MGFIEGTDVMWPKERIEPLTLTKIVLNYWSCRPRGWYESWAGAFGGTEMTQTSGILPINSAGTRKAPKKGKKKGG